MRFWKLLFANVALLSWCALPAQELPYLDQSEESPEWVRLMYSENADPGEVIAAYDQYFRDREFVKTKHTQFYKRWIRGITRDLGSNGISARDRQYLNKRAETNSQNRSTTNAWTSLGPWDWDHDAADRSYAPGAAHVYTVQQCVSQPDVLYAGTATAGIWKSTDRGISWSCVTNDRIVNGLTALAVSDPDPDLVFAEMHSNVFKTDNGGATWVATGDGSFQSMEFNTKDIVFHPESSSSIWICTDAGLYESSNSGSTWTQMVSGDFLELEFHPANFDTIYAVRLAGEETEFLRSVDGGTSFSVQTTGWPSPDVPNGEEQRRTEIAVSPAQPDLVIALATGVANGGSGLYGIYRSTDAGATWSFECCGPQPAGPPSDTNMNLMGWSDQGTDPGGQYYYDLALDISPTNADSVFVGGVNLWISGDGGSSFVCPAKWSHPHKPGYVHADIHDIRYMPSSSEIWLACDGGIFYSSNNGDNFTRRMTGISGTDFWGFGAGERDGDVMLGGTYHNGTLLKDGDVYLNDWVCTDGGDNYRGFVHPMLPRQAFSDYNIKELSGDRTVQNDTRGFSNKPNASYSIGQSSDILFHPNYWQTWFTGSDSSLWRTDDNGYSFVEVHNFAEKVASADICLTDPKTICVTTFPDWWETKHVFITHDGGESWANITPTPDVLAGNTWVPYDVAISATDPQRIWLARTSMYSSTNLGGVEILESVDGGASWINITDDLPLDESCTSIIHHAGSEQGLYIGTRRTVYYRSENTEGWELFGSGLPASTASTRLSINYGDQRIVNGTNRSAWAAPLVDNFNSIAIPALAGSRHTCVGDSVSFVDNSILPDSASSWTWYFPGAQPEVSNVADPVVSYSKAGLYDVTLIVSNGEVTDTFTIPKMVEVLNDCGLDGIPGKALSCTASPDYAIASGFDHSVDSFTVLAWVKPSGIQNDYTAIVMNDDETGGLNFREGNNTLGYHWPGGQWWWDSNLEVPVDQWSHVALVVTPSYVRVYLDGFMSQHTVSTSPMTLTTLRIGSYKGWDGRNYSGLIDEVAIYDRALTTDEIRARRHLTLNPQEEEGLLSYYQFNEDSGLIFDKAGHLDAILNGGATRIRSRAPVGWGISEVQSIISTGTYDYPSVHCSLAFPSGSSLPGGDVWIARIQANPDTLPQAPGVMHNGYWILNNYGSEQLATLHVEFDSVGFISNQMSLTDSLGLQSWGRDANEEMANWFSHEAEQAIGSGMGGSLSVECTKPVQYGQIILTRTSLPSGTASLRMSTVTEGQTREGGNSIALDLHNPDTLGFILALIDDDDLLSFDSVASGSMAFHVQRQVVIFFDGQSWEAMDSDYLGPADSSMSSMQFGFSLDTTEVQRAILSLGSGGFLNPATSTDSATLEIDFPAIGSLLYLPDHKSPAVYDGAAWRIPETTSLEITPGDGQADDSVEGIVVGDYPKRPHSRLDLGMGQWPLGLPIIQYGEVANPAMGTLIYDPVLGRLCVFTGTSWNKVAFK